MIYIGIFRFLAGIVYKYDNNFYDGECITKLVIRVAGYANNQL